VHKFIHSVSGRSVIYAEAAGYRSGEKVPGEKVHVNNESTSAVMEFARRFIK